MGLVYKIINSERKELDTVTCDKCGVEIKKNSEGGWNPFGEPYSIYHSPSFENFFLLEQSWGYGSNKDGEVHTAALCEPCYDEVFKDVKINRTDSMWGNIS
jgi:hypothetical protein